jgi:hypothetical protein
VGTRLNIPFGNKELAMSLGARYRTCGWFRPGTHLEAFQDKGRYRSVFILPSLQVARVTTPVLETFTAAMVAANHSERKDRAMSTPVIDGAELARMLARNGLNLGPEQVRAILAGVPIFQQMIARVNAPLPREAEPALTFNVEQR